MKLVIPNKKEPRFDRLSSASKSVALRHLTFRRCDHPLEPKPKDLAQLLRSARVLKAIFYMKEERVSSLNNMFKCSEVGVTGLICMADQTILAARSGAPFFLLHGSTRHRGQQMTLACNSL